MIDNLEEMSLSAGFLRELTEFAEWMSEEPLYVLGPIMGTFAVFGAYTVAKRYLPERFVSLPKRLAMKCVPDKLVKKYLSKKETKDHGVGILSTLSESEVQKRKKKENGESFRRFIF